MFFVINSEKIYAYVISILTVMLLFFMAEMFIPKSNTIETSTDIKNNIYKENTNQLVNE